MVQAEHPCARHAHDVSLERLAVGGAVATLAPHRRADDQWHRHLVGEHEGKFRGVVDPLVERQRDKVAEHDLHHRLKSAQRQAVADADDRQLADGSVADPARIAGRQLVGALEGAAVRAFNVLPDENHTLVGRERRVEAPLHRPHRPLLRKLKRPPRHAAVGRARWLDHAKPRPFGGVGREGHFLIDLFFKRLPAGVVGERPFQDRQRIAVPMALYVVGRTVVVSL